MKKKKKYIKKIKTTLLGIFIFIYFKTRKKTEREREIRGQKETSKGKKNREEDGEDDTVQ